MIEDKIKREKKPIASPSPLQKKKDMGGKEELLLEDQVEVLEMKVLIIEIKNQMNQTAN